MDSLDLLGTTLGLGFLAGIRLYGTILALGLGIRLGWLHLPHVLEHLQVLANPVVLILAGVMFLIELLADKIPWVDSVWDSFHTIVRPIGAILLAATAISSVDPLFKVVLVLLCGGVAFTSHSSKAATRMMVNSGPAAATTVGLSLAGDVMLPFGVWLTMQHPILTLVLVAAFLTVFVWLSARVFRAVLLQFTALGARLRRHAPYNPGPVAMPQGLRPETAETIAMLLRQVSPLPPDPAETLQNQLALAKPPTGIRCAATKRIHGLRNSVGYLTISSDKVAFVTRRMFRYRIHCIPISSILHARLEPGLLMNRLVFETTEGERVFYLFKDIVIRRAA